jgi:hypothetical protein
MEVMCPICGSSLADEQFNLATQKLNERLTKLNIEQMKGQEKKFEMEKLEFAKKHKQEVQILERTSLTQIPAMESLLK